MEEAPNTRPGMSPALAAAAVLLAGLGIWWWLGKQSGDTAHADAAGSHPVAEQISQRPAHGRLGLLDDFSMFAEDLDGAQQLDELVIQQRLELPELSAVEFESLEHEQIAKAFHQAMMKYAAPTQVQHFLENASRMIATPQGPEQQQLMQSLGQQPGGKEFIQSEGDAALMESFRNSMGMRMGQLRREASLRQAQQLRIAYREHWTEGAFAQHAVALAPEYPLDPKAAMTITESRRRLLRWWELHSVQYLLCVSGNEEFGLAVRQESLHQALPIYRNLLNAMVDPSHRRFAHLGSFEIQTSSDEPTAPPRLVHATNGPVALVEFDGALPRLKLFADWQSGLDETATGELLYQPGFNPHQQVLLKETIEAPAQPSQTSALPRVEVVHFEPHRMELKIPATHFPTVLLINDPHDPEWTATLAGQPAKLLRANGHALAVQIPPAENGQTLILERPADAQHSMRTTVVVIVILLLTGIFVYRRTSPAR